MATINTGEGYTDSQQHELRGEAAEIAERLERVMENAEQQKLDISEQLEAVRELLESERHEAARRLLSELEQTVANA